MIWHYQKLKNLLKKFMKWEDCPTELNHSPTECVRIPLIWKKTKDWVCAIVQITKKTKTPTANTYKLAELTKSRKWLTEENQKTKKMNTKKPKYIKRSTPKRAKQTRLYNKLVASWKVGKVCEFPYCRSKADHCHHSRGRVGRLLLAQEHWIALCEHHHHWVHENIKQAREMGLFCELGQFNTYED